jgi:phytoene synthase
VSIAAAPGPDLTGEVRSIIRAGSKSFALASRLMGRRERGAAWRLYAWCRHCDDVIDGQVLGHGMRAKTEGTGEGASEGTRERLAELRRLTALAFHGDAELPAPFQALREVARASSITEAQAMALLDGFAMDVEGRAYATLGQVLDYAFHVAGVVGVMMAEVMGVTDRPVLQRACDLGLAFQLTNIARDVIEDACAGRLYLPADWLAAEGVAARPEAVADPANRLAVARVAARLLGEADRYYRSARDGLGALPFRSAWAIGSARGVYRAIGRIVRRRGARAWDRRAGVPATGKLALLARGYALALAARLPLPAVRTREGLWTPPDRLTASSDAPWSPSAPR